MEMETLYSIQEVAKRLGVSVSTVRALLRAGEFPGAYKAGRGLNSHYRVPSVDLAAFIERHRPTSRQAAK